MSMEVSFDLMKTDRFVQKTNPRKYTSKANERSVFPVHYYFRDYSADSDDSSIQEILPEPVEPKQVEIASLKAQTESMDVIDKLLPPSTPPSTPKTAVLPLKFQTVISEIQENVTNSSPIDNAPETTHLGSEMVTPTHVTKQPSSANKWNDHSPKIREPPPADYSPKVHVSHGLPCIRGHNPRDSRRITRMNINTGAYKTMNDNPVIFEPHLPSGIKSRIAPQMDISTKFVPDLASSPTDTTFDKDLPQRTRQRHSSRK